MNNQYEYEPYLMHYGVLGMKWGIRRYQPYSVRGRKDGRDGVEVGEAKKASKEKAKKAAKIGAAVAGAGVVGFGTSKAYGKLTDEQRNALFEPSIKGGKDKPNVSPASKIGSDAGNIVNNVSNIVNVANKSRNTENQYAKQLSDDELKKIIQRLELEKRFSDLSKEEIQRSKVTTNDILLTVGSTIAIGKSIADIISLYLKIKGVT